MMIYRIDVLNALKKRGYSTYKIRQQNILSQSTITKLNQNDTNITMKNIDIICQLLNCQPSDFLEYIDKKD